MAVSLRECGCTAEKLENQECGRGDLSDAQWNKLEPLLPPQKPNIGRPAENHRKIINGILWILRTGAPWRDLPICYGIHSTVSSRFYRWRKVGIWDDILAKLQTMADIDLNN